MRMKISTFDSLNNQHLEMFRFIQINFICFSNVVSLFIQYSSKKIMVSSLQIIHKEKLLRHTTIYNKQ